MIESFDFNSVQKSFTQALKYPLKKSYIEFYLNHASNVLSEVPMK